MKSNRLRYFLLFWLVSVVLQLPAQQSDADRKLLADVRAKAEKGEAQSQSELGDIFLFGSLGVAKDEVEAVKWLRNAAEQNHTGAQVNLGICYVDGKGLAQDYTEAVKWYRNAAKQNEARAQFFLGGCYYNSLGVVKDEVEAYKWALLASAQGYEDARVVVRQLEERMPQAQIAEGQKLARNFKPVEVPPAKRVSSGRSVWRMCPESSGR